MHIYIYLIYIYRLGISIYYLLTSKSTIPNIYIYNNMHNRILDMTLPIMKIRKQPNKIQQIGESIRERVKKVNNGKILL